MKLITFTLLGLIAATVLDSKPSNNFDDFSSGLRDIEYEGLPRSNYLDLDSLFSRYNGYKGLGRPNYLDLDSLFSRHNGYKGFSRSNYFDLDSILSRENGYEAPQLSPAPNGFSGFTFGMTPVERGNVIHIFPALPKIYTISFDLILNSIVRGLANVLHFTTGNNHLPYGSRIPALFFHGDTLYIYSDVNNVYRRLYRTQFPLKQPVRIEISYAKIGPDYFFIYNDGEKTLRDVIKNPQVFTNVMVYASNKWYMPFDGEIRNFKVVLGFPVDGGYSDWSSYSECSVSCGGGTKSRNRTCTKPTPAHDGNDCSKLGNSSETKSCNTQPCPVDGGYSDWSSYSECSVSCGGGTKSRNRSCTKPTPAHDGNDCSKLGKSLETTSCNTQPCPVDGGYSDWSSYSECSVSCGGGTKSRNRSCTKPTPAHDGNDCSKLGKSLETTSCKTQPCPVNGGFSAWIQGVCSVPCGGGFLTETRTCDNPAPLHGGEECHGDVNRTKACNEHVCRISTINYARGKVTSQSSFRYSAAQMIDGNYESIGSTARGTGQWLGIDLGSIVDIMEIKAYAWDYNANDLKSSELFIGTTDIQSEMKLLATFESHPVRQENNYFAYVVKFKTPQKGRYLRVVMPTSGLVAIREFEVYLVDLD